MWFAIDSLHHNTECISTVLTIFGVVEVVKTLDIHQRQYLTNRIALDKENVLHNREKLIAFSPLLTVSSGVLGQTLFTRIPMEFFIWLLSTESEVTGHPCASLFELTQLTTFSKLSHSMV